MKAFADDARPEPPRGAKLGDLFQQIVMRVEEERDARRKLIDLQAGFESSLDISNGIGEGKGQFLDRRRPGLSDVIAADRNCVPVGHLERAEREGVRNQAQRRFRRKDVGPARDVFLQNIVLNSAVYFGKRNALLARDREIETQQDGCRSVYRH